MCHFVLAILDKVVLAAIVGVVSSAIFLWLLSKMRPKLEITPKIAKGDNGFRVKVVNKTNSPVIDVRAQLHLMRPSQAMGGDIEVSQPIDLLRSELMVIEKYDPKDEDTEYAYRFVTSEDLEGKWKDESPQFIRFRITCRHAISGFSGYFVRDYRSKRNDIVVGTFEKGDSFNIR